MNKFDIMKTYRIIRVCVNLLLIVFMILYIITGFGITEYKIVESITLSLLSKPVSHLIHTNLFIPFIVLLILHVLLSSKSNYFKKLFNRFVINEREN